MTGDYLTIRQVIVLLSAIIYWGGVVVNVIRVKVFTGISPNITPRGLKENFLWISWLIVISGWIVQPLIISPDEDALIFSSFTVLWHPLGIYAGLFLALSGYAATVWCYSVLGNFWRMGIDKKETTLLIQRGPYRVMRHPIYVFQVVILAGMTCLIPTLFSLIILFIHFITICVKMLDEESYLLQSLGNEYKNYSDRTGRFLPKW